MLPFQLIMALALKRIFGNNIHAVKRAFPCTILSQKRFLPICTVSTNLAENKIPDKFGEELVDLIADVLSKPKNVSWNVFLFPSHNLWYKIFYFSFTMYLNIFTLEQINLNLK